MKKPYSLILTLALCVAGASVTAIAQSTDPQSSQPQSSTQPQTPETQTNQPSQPDREKNPASTQIQEQIQSALRQDPSSAYSAVTVNAHEDEIVLSGTVASKQAKHDAESIAKMYANGRKVKNEIQVSKSNPAAPGPGF